MAQTGESLWRLWLYSGILLVAIIVLGSAVMLYRRKFLSDNDSGTSRDPWSLDDLHELRSQGKITDDEFRAMRSAIIRAYTGETADHEGQLPEVSSSLLPPEEGGSDPDATEETGDQWDWVAENDPRESKNFRRFERNG